MSVIHGDFLKVEIERNSVDLICTSPPYNLKVDYRTYKDDKPYPEYLEWVGEVLTKFREILKADGRFCIVVPFTIRMKGEAYNRPIQVDWINKIQTAGLNFFTCIAWDKQTVGKNCYGSFSNAGAPFIRDRAECIIVGFNDRWKKIDRGANMDRRKFIEWTENLWSITPSRFRYHPAPFPSEIAERCIKLFSFRDQVVCDPFMGSGTVIHEANRLHRRYVGIDIHKPYVDMARRYMEDRIKANAYFKEVRKEWREEAKEREKISEEEILF